MLKILTYHMDMILGIYSSQMSLCLFHNNFDHVHKNFQNIWCHFPKSQVLVSSCIVKQQWIAWRPGLRLNGTQVRCVPGKRTPIMN